VCVNLRVSWKRTSLGHWKCADRKSMVKGSNLFDRSSSTKTPGGDTRGLPASKRGRWIGMRKIPLLPIHGRLRQGKAAREPGRRVNLRDNGPVRRGAHRIKVAKLNARRRTIS
jgi:hypothetical protein